MSHNIQENDAAAFNAQPAWHGLGQVLPEGDLNIERVRRQLPGFLFPIESRPLIVGDRTPVFTADGVLADGVVPMTGADGAPRIVPDKVAQVAGDTGEVLAVTGDGYEVFDNGQLLDLAARISAFGDGTTLESALTLRGRRTAVVLAHAGQFVLPGDDVNESYYLFTTTHDGTAALQVLPTSVRVVCSNTLALAQASSKNTLRARHTSNMAVAIEAGVEAMRNGAAFHRQFEQQARAMASKPASKADVQRFFQAVYEAQYGALQANPKTRGEKARYTRAVEMVASWTRNLDDPKQRMQGSTTVWSLFNSVTQYADHESNVRRTGGETAASARNHSRLFGQAGKLKDAALSQALALV
jgi:phage/plasmid-like protein (TIGR03299 family)